MSLTARQLEVQKTIAGDATHIMLFGGSRSGKTYLHVRNMVMRAIKAPKSRHCMLRFRLSHIKTSIVMDTFPRVMATAFQGVNYTLNKSDLFVRFENESEIWFAGLDDKDRTEKILGNEYATILLNECSQISWGARNTVVTRLAQRVETKIKGKEATPLKTRMFYDCNPPNKSHWTYKVFVKKVDPETNQPLPNPDAYVAMQMNPGDNRDNVSEEYMQTLESLSPRLRKRFLVGEFADANPDALFPDEIIDKWRVIDGSAPEFVRIVVAVDPSGCDDEDNADNDEIGIVVAGLGTDGNAYILEDCTVKAGPATWGRVATSAYDRHEANMVVGEINYGGAMVNHVIQTARPRTPYQSVSASRGKHIRAEPISSLYDAGRVRHLGVFQKLEDELSGFSTHGYTGERSPNRADAAIWAITALFPGIINKRTKKPEEGMAKKKVRVQSGLGWMGN